MLITLLCASRDLAKLSVRFVLGSVSNSFQGSSVLGAPKLAPLWPPVHPLVSTLRGFDNGLVKLRCRVRFDVKRPFGYNVTASSVVVCNSERVRQRWKYRVTLPNLKRALFPLFFLVVVVVIFLSLVTTCCSYNIKIFILILKNHGDQMNV